MRLVVVSNRVPVTKDTRTVQGGLAVALLAALEQQDGLWFGWNGKTSTATSGQVELSRQGKVEYATIPLQKEDYDNYYKGYANRVLWPVFHDRVNLMDYQREYLDAYERVNQLFARRLRPLLRPDDRLWIHDYHCIPLGHHLRQAGVRQVCGFFLHIPFPYHNVLRAVPGFHQLLRYMCAYDLLGFQTELDRRAFLECVRLSLPEARIRGASVHIDGMQVRTIAAPISIDIEDVAQRALSGRESVQGARLRESLMGRQLILGVDRLDYSKGLVERFRAFETLLQDYPANRGKVVFMQVAQPSRGDVPEYQDIRRRLEALAGSINGRYSEYDWMPIRYLNKSFGRAAILGFLSIAHVGLVTPLRDGMNLVAKEFVAAQVPHDPGVLVLSELAGAAQELEGALLVNPHDTHGVGAAIARAIAMREGERIERWQQMMHHLRRNDIHHWRKRFLSQLERIAASA